MSQTVHAASNAALATPPVAPATAHVAQAASQAAQAAHHVAHAATDPALWWGLLGFLVVGVATVVLGKWTDFLRDSDPVNFAGAKPAIGAYRRPYSLAQTQMAWWFAIITGSFVFLCASQHGDPTGLLNSQTLTLLGIGSGTAIGASIIEQTKTGQLTTLAEFQNIIKQVKLLPPTPNNSALYARRDELAAQLASEGFFKDLVTDVDGVTVHRFQSVAWTLILGIVFAVGVLTQHLMPQFEPTTLGLLGISGGTYLGFKIPEQPA